MKPFLRISLQTGHTYEIPAEVIVGHRAAVMLKLHPDEFTDLDAARVDTQECFDDAAEVRDWALNNMNPTDYMPSARLVRFTPCEQDHSTAEWSLHDYRAVIQELDGEEILRQPVESVLTTMAASNQLCNVTVLNNSDGKAFAGLAVFIGDEKVIAAFATSLSFMADRLAGSPAPEAATDSIVH